ncbi:TPA: ATP-binding cassette domain-containing protein [Streptococcus equi subsp. zooepidemicus]|uniref:ABC transporter ATP-binding protein n=1 Tax=Streptococcus equi subsp. zooepidemicus SzS31A1 TaxID=1352602 RepID=A0ABP2X992_STRSZ|nr:ATP-binding cassette domain-containing protein [Streptococcus equi]EQB23258.1 ABC transporter ATP-binding protein [Streptococcus equi subsp. zooepidemicus SzS31A1]MCD3394086.1 ATP-binding cassette domain-containing protein [Streptococcus equi subsp. zooepidemicus]MCD3456231.1 ATP-binding cassette domain-containing protein [Streptococcus equi subsp. zooepidemicus]MCD3462892.1 ATP-binding cassette domain-containing protein [Streptococcus equi subsp. zooepidemicus]MDI5915087.1 ATP-binding cass
MIELKQLSKHYGKKKIYDKLSLTFEANRSYALVGPSGSGKTTLLNAIARLEKPDSGQILVNGQDIWSMKEQDYFKDYLGYVFQNYALIEEETVYDNLKMLAPKSNIVEALHSVGLDSSFLSQCIYELSGGQAQRVAIARLLLKKACIILADEPTGALDKETGDEIIELLLSLVSPDTVLIFATHDPNVFSRVDDIIDICHLQ